MKLLIFSLYIVCACYPNEIEQRNSKTAKIIYSLRVKQLGTVW